MSSRYDKFVSNMAKNIKASEIRELLAIIRRRKDIISLAGGLPDPATFPKKELIEITKKVIEERGDLALQYCETKGVIEVREALSRFMYEAKGVKVNPENIIITTGSQQAIDLVAKTLIEPGDNVITENPSYLAALGTFKNYYAKITGVWIDEYGMKTDQLEELVKKMAVSNVKMKFIYVIPIAQNPSGVSMTLDRKKHLLEIASRYDLLVLEDDPYSYFIYDSNADVTSLKAIDKEERVIYVSTISKILAPGLRVGWVISPEDLSRRFELVKQYLDLNSPTLNQYVFAECINSGLLKQHISKLGPYYKVKRDSMVRAIEERFPEETWFIRPIGGLFLMTYVKIPGFDASELLTKAVEKYGVAYVPGVSFHTDGSGRNSMRLNFSYPTVDKIVEGVERLATMIKTETGKAM